MANQSSTKRPIAQSGNDPAVSRRRFLTGAAGAATAAVVAIPAAATEPEMTPVELAEWHCRELARLIGQDGGVRLTIIAVAEYNDNRGKFGGGVRSICLRDDAVFRNEEGMFGGKAVL